ncbi:hypothetical protein Pcinc_033298 [Petrolisthes cinctipes]|uniref:Uncharacterized protein n=1 Tax=Petrolisthes cinctipes TaxID=88211 RepID=A0AAE1K220_PETCI|nr:hypothetical protein Pcinc_033298 [Petrolisthes cinctipes]
MIPRMRRPNKGEESREVTLTHLDILFFSMFGTLGGLKKGFGEEEEEKRARSRKRSRLKRIIRGGGGKEEKKTKSRKRRRVKKLIGEEEGKRLRRGVEREGE